MDNCEVVTKMIDAIEERGWCQGQLEDDRGRVCIRGALGVALADQPMKWWDGGTYESIEAAIDEFLPIQFRSGTVLVGQDPVVAFNNDEGTTKEDVIDVLQKTKEKVC